jgi:hypothetical protein
MRVVRVLDLRGCVREHAARGPAFPGPAGSPRLARLGRSVDNRMTGPTVDRARLHSLDRQ